MEGNNVEINEHTPHTRAIRWNSIKCLVTAVVVIVAAVGIGYYFYDSFSDHDSIENRLHSADGSELPYTLKELIKVVGEECFEGMSDKKKLEIIENVIKNDTHLNMYNIYANPDKVLEEWKEKSVHFNYYWENNDPIKIGESRLNKYVGMIPWKVIKKNGKYSKSDKLRICLLWYYDNLNVLSGELF